MEPTLIAERTGRDRSGRVQASSPEADAGSVPPAIRLRRIYQNLWPAGAKVPVMRAIQGAARPNRIENRGLNRG